MGTHQYAGPSHHIVSNFGGSFDRSGCQGELSRPATTKIDAAFCSKKLASHTTSEMKAAGFAVFAEVPAHETNSTTKADETNCSLKPVHRAGSNR